MASVVVVPVVTGMTAAAAAAEDGAIWINEQLEGRKKAELLARRHEIDEEKKKSLFFFARSRDARLIRFRARFFVSTTTLLVSTISHKDQIVMN